MRLPRRFSLRSLLLLILAGASVAAVVLKWDAWQLTLALNPTGNPVKWARFSPDGSSIVTNAYPDNSGSRFKYKTSVWNRSGEQLYQTEWYPKMWVWYDRADFKLGSRWLQLSMFVEAGPFASQLIDMKSNQKLFPENCEAGYVSFTPDERRCAVALSDEKNERYWLAVYDLDSGKILCEERAYFAVPNRKCREARISPDGRRVIAICEDIDEHGPNKVFLVYFDLKTGTIARSNPAYDQLYIVDLAFSADGSRVVLLNSSELRVLDAVTDRILFERRTVHFAGYEYRNPRGVEHLLFESKRNVFHLDLRAKELKPVAISNVSLSDSQIFGEWLAWHDGKDAVRLRNIVSGLEPDVAVRPLKLLSFEWKLQEFNSSLVFNSPVGCYCFQKESGRIFKSDHELLPSPDGTRVLAGLTPSFIFAMDQRENSPRGKITTRELKPGDIQWAPDGNALITRDFDGPEARVWTCVRDDAPGAFLFLPELWLAIAFFCAFLFSVRDDLRRLRSPV